MTADGTDLAHITVTVADDYGVPVYLSADEITWQISGPARLLGLESGDHTSSEAYQSSRRRVFQGRQIGYVQATKTSGEVIVTLTAPGLDEARVVIQAK